MDPAALGWLALKGVAVAALPLAYIAWSRDAGKFRKLAWLTAFLTLDLIMFGSFTRLADAGLGCPDWPGCYGHSNPLSAGDAIRAAESAQPSGPVTEVKAWIEMLHRYFAMGIGFLIIVLAIAAWRPPSRARSGRTRWLAFAALVWVCIQGAFGALTVTMRLQPAIVTLHLLGGIALLALLVWLALEQQPASAHSVSGGARARPLGVWPVLALVAAVVQIALGGWVSTNYAVMACPDFPLCQGSAWPSMDFRDGFTLWRPLGMTSGGELISFQALVAIHWVHRAFSLIVIAVSAVLIARAWNVGPVARPARWLLAVLALQLLTGMSNVVLQWPLAGAVLHTGGAALIVALLVTIIVRASPTNR
jgi:heme a synthase